MVEKLEVLVVGPYPTWDLAHMDGSYRLRRLWEAPDRDNLLHDCRDVLMVTLAAGQPGDGRLRRPAGDRDALERARIARAGLDVLFGEPRFAVLEI